MTVLVFWPSPLLGTVPYHPVLLTIIALPFACGRFLVYASAAHQRPAVEFPVHTPPDDVFDRQPGG